MARSTLFADFARRAALALVIAAGFAGAAVILEDDFTDPVASHGKWANSNPDLMSVGVEGGNCVLTNSSEAYISEYLHTFDGAKPSTFTASYVQKSASGDRLGGLFFCRPSALNGYLLTLYQGQTPIVFKYTNGNGESVFQGSGVDVKASDNKFAVSKQGSEFHIFVNDVYQGKFTDSQYPSGDIALYVEPKTSVTFGSFRMTDEFTKGEERTSFSDDFSGNNLKYWNILHNGSPSAAEADGVMKVNTGADDVLWAYVDLNLAHFEAKVEVKHKSGGNTSPYGIVLIGENVPGQNIPMVYFTIQGDRKFAIWKSESQSQLSDVTLAIMGAGFVDAIEVKRELGSSTYEFIANGTTLSANYPVVDFNIVGIGVFGFGGLELAFDNFYAAQIKDPTSVKPGAAQISRRPAGAKKPGSTVFYDLRGRKRYTMTATPAAGRLPIRAAGVYVSENGREVRLRKVER